MNIKMIGVDYENTPVEQREAFSLTKARQREILPALRDTFRLQGCLLLSTCNRTELWVCGAEKHSPADLLAFAVGSSRPVRQAALRERTGRRALSYLMELACGMRSQLYGEDQILGQIKEAAVLSRELNCMNAELETAFRLAVTGAKRVKTQTRLCPTRPSAATAAIEKLRQTYGPLRGIPCLILGGGTMARLTAKALLAEGCAVTMARRSHPGEHGPAPALPPGVSTLAYEDRYPALSRFPIVCSATASPHLTIRWEQARPYLGKTFQTFVDLAVPRDIDPALHQCPGILLWDIDDLPSGKEHPSPRSIQAAKQILRDCEREFFRWETCRSGTPIVETLSASIAEDACRRFCAYQPGQEELLPAIREAVRKAVCKGLYSLPAGRELPPQRLAAHLLKQEKNR